MKKKTDWNKEKNRQLLVKAMKAKLNALVAESAQKDRRPESWLDFLDDNGIGTWGRDSECDPDDLRYEYPDHVWIKNPDIDFQGEAWGIDYDNYMTILCVPYDFAEKMVKALMLGGAEAA